MFHVGNLRLEGLAASKVGTHGWKTHVPKSLQNGFCIETYLIVFCVSHFKEKKSYPTLWLKKT